VDVEGAAHLGVGLPSGASFAGGYTVFRTSYRANCRIPLLALLLTPFHLPTGGCFSRKLQPNGKNRAWLAPRRFFRILYRPLSIKCTPLWDVHLMICERHAVIYRLVDIPKGCTTNR
jgi:hypothetical protein